MAAGRVDVLLVHHADPVGCLPAALGAAAAIARVPVVVSFSDLPDETSALAHLSLPDNHPLETFGDLSPRRGVVALSQPVMTPLWDTRSASQVLIEVAAKIPSPAAALPYDDAYAFAQSRTAKLFSGLTGDELAAAQRGTQQRGVQVSEAKAEAVSLRRPSPGPLAAPAPASEARALDLVVFPTVSRADGSAGERPWLKELPDLLTTISWTGWAELAPATAKRLGVANGDILALTTAAGSVELPACIFEGVREDAVAVPLGGREPLALLPAAADARTGALLWQGARADVRITGRRIALPRLSATPYEEGRTIVRTVSAALPTVPRSPEPPEMYPPPSFPEHRWAMAIDMDRCVGCQACVVACYA
jgi:hypothetical protein